MNVIMIVMKEIVVTQFNLKELILVYVHKDLVVLVLVDSLVVLMEDVLLKRLVLLHSRLLIVQQDVLYL